MNISLPVPPPLLQRAFEAVVAAPQLPERDTNFVPLS